MPTGTPSHAHEHRNTHAGEPQQAHESTVSSTKHFAEYPARNQRSNKIERVTRPPNATEPGQTALLLQRAGWNTRTFTRRRAPTSNRDPEGNRQRRKARPPPDEQVNQHTGRQRRRGAEWEMLRQLPKVAYAFALAVAIALHEKH